MDIRVPVRNIRKFSMCGCVSSRCYLPRCASVANEIRKLIQIILEGKGEAVHVLN
jgi:hypothetical protein